MLTAAELASHYRTSTRQVQRWVAAGMPYIPTGARGKRFTVEQSERWLQETYGCRTPGSKTVRGTFRSVSSASDFIAASRRVHLRVTPSS